MNQPKISVIVPVYKVEAYLHRCLDSIIGQTYGNLEIILVDDGSPDNCGAICDEYATDPCVRVIHQENGGVSAARNAGLRVATGEWIGFVDGDDWIEPDMYAYLLQLGLEHGADVVQCGFFLEDEFTSEEMFCASEERFLPGNAEQFGIEDWKQIGNSTCNKLYRAECVRDVLYDPECSMGEDLLFNLHVLQHGSGIVLGAQTKYHYVQHEESACHTPPSADLLRSHREVLKQATRLFSTDSAVYAFFVSERLKMDMHNCSRMAQFPEMDLVRIKPEIRADLRRETPRILRMQSLSAWERAKLLLIAWGWWLYQILLLESKKTGK